MIRLEETLYDASSYNDYLIEKVLERDSPAASGTLCVQISRYFRAIGICRLLIDADVDGFFHGLERSALTWRWFLEASQNGPGLADPARKASFVAPLADAITADRLRLAVRIADLAPQELRADYEYEEDYLYARFLFALARDASSADPELQARLERWQAVLEGGEDLRLPICAALHRRDSAGFDAAFLALAETRASKLAERADPQVDGVAAYDYDFVPNWRIWVEGLALLRLAEDRGLELRPEYPTCPSIARLRERAPLPRASFPPGFDETA